MQNYCSFIASFQSFEKLITKTGCLPHEATEMIQYSYEDFSLLLFISDNPLYEHYFVKNKQGLAIFINGFFYDRIDSSFFKAFNNLNHNESNCIKSILNTLNGSFNGVIINIHDRAISCFTDIFGYQKLFYTYEENHVIVSSFIWPLLKHNSALNPSSINEFITLGFSLGSKSLIRNIFYIKPGFLITLQDNSFDLNESIYEEYPNSFKYKSKKQYAEEFLHYVNEYADYLKYKIHKEVTYLSLTGGGDSRVILNSFINIGKKPICITGSAPMNDQIRSKKITESLKLKYIPINYTNELNCDFDKFKTILLTTNGFNNGHQMSQIAKAPENPNSLLFYGFSGDLLSGSMAIDLNDKDYESLPNAIFPYIAQYKGLSLNLLPKLLGYSDNSVKESFLNNFNSYKDFSIEDAYYYLQKNEHDFKRIGSFADGSKLGNSIPVYFFHNRKIINFYKGLPPDFKKNESLHNYLGYFHNLRLGLIPSSGRLNIPVFLLPLILNSVSKESLVRWNNFYRRHKKSVYLKINIGDTFFEIFRDDWNLLNKFIDTVQLNQLIVNNQFEVTSLNILRLRILNIMQLFKLVDHLNTKNLHQISYPLIIKNVDFYQESK